MEADTGTGHDRALGEALDAALARWSSSARACTLLFSGGIDSTLLAWELRGAPAVQAITVGLAGSRDLAAAEPAARRLGLRWVGHAAHEAELTTLRARLDQELEGAAPSLRGVFLGLAAAIDAAPTRELLLGQGADELFLGYAHFRGLDGPRAAERAATDLQRLLEDDWPRTVRIAQQLGHEVFAPYLAPAFVAAASSIPIALRLPVPEPKRWLRQWAIRRGLPPDLAARPKMALQYGTGVARWLSHHREGGAALRP